MTDRLQEALQDLYEAERFFRNSRAVGFSSKTETGFKRLQSARTALEAELGEDDG